MISSTNICNCVSYNQSYINFLFMLTLQIANNVWCFSLYKNDIIGKFNVLWDVNFVIYSWFEAFGLITDVKFTTVVSVMFITSLAVSLAMQALYIDRNAGSIIMSNTTVILMLIPIHNIICENFVKMI